MGTFPPYPLVTEPGLTRPETTSKVASKAVVINTTRWLAVRSRLSAAFVKLSALGSMVYRRDRSSPSRASSFWGRTRTAGGNHQSFVAARLAGPGLAIQPAFQLSFRELAQRP